jgi:Sec-independent protein secretion pathway component TatC
MYFATNLIVIAFCIFLIGVAIYFYFVHDPRIWWMIAGIVTTPVDA